MSKNQFLLSVFSLLLVSAACNPGGIPKVNNEEKDLTPVKKKGESDSYKQFIVNIETKRQGIEDTIHGIKVKDPYRWLEDAKSSETQHWMDEQNKHARKHLNSLPGIKNLYKRLNELSYIDQTGAPMRRGKRYFFYRQHADKEKFVYYWKEGENGEVKVLLDPNKMSEDGSISVKGIYVSYDGKLAAYKISKNNSDAATLMVMDVATGNKLAGEEIPGCKYAAPSWDPNGKGFYYTRLPLDPKIEVNQLPGYAEVYYHRIGTNWKKDKLIHPATKDPKKFLHVNVSRDGRYLLAFISFGWSRTDVYYKTPYGGRWNPLVVNTDKEYANYSVTWWKGKFYIHTNHKAPRYKLMMAIPARINQKYWKDVIPERSDAVLDNFSIVAGKLSLTWLKKASTTLEVADLDGKNLKTVALPGIGTSGGISGNPDDKTGFYSFSSFTSPKAIFEYDFTANTSKEFFKVKVPFDPAPYTTEQVEYKSKDGTVITMFIIRRSNMVKNGENPFILYGYGGFNVSITPYFSSGNIPWLENGGSIAIPNLRGGGEYGEQWHRDGMLLKKQNVFDDFIGAAEYLIKNKYTKPAKLSIRGGSNGGLLVGAAMVQRPELFRAVSCHVPLLDMVRYHLFGSGETWISEYGDPRKQDHFTNLFSYSPYHHVKYGIKYPALLMTSADSDDRVDPMHARKFTAAMQYSTLSGLPVLLRINKNSGHSGGDMVKKRVESQAEEYAFLMYMLGMSKSEIKALNKKFVVESD